MHYCTEETKLLDFQDEYDNYLRGPGLEIVCSEQCGSSPGNSWDISFRSFLFINSTVFFIFGTLSAVLSTLFLLKEKAL